MSIGTDGFVCIVGRCQFDTGIGIMTYAACEMFARSFDTCIIPSEVELRQTPSITLPNGRIIAVCKNPVRVRAAVCCDVLWNGLGDLNYMRVPQNCLRLACISWDLDALPQEWVDILNGRFDAALCLSSHLEKVLDDSNVGIPHCTLPLALDLGPLLSRRSRTLGPKRRFGSIAAFHPRKGAEKLIRAFADAFKGDTGVELVLHSNLVFGEHIEMLKHVIADLGANNITISHDNLNAAAKADLLESFDILVNLSQGEGYSIGPREALALGKPCVLSDVGGHRELRGTPGVFFVPSKIRVPARYPEINNRIFGAQFAVAHDDAVAALRSAREYVESGADASSRASRRNIAADCSFDRLSSAYAEVISSAPARFRRHLPKPRAVNAADGFLANTQTIAARYGGSRGPKYTVVPAHDGGFFSLFNVFFSHFVWSAQDERCHGVWPDWDVARFVARMENEKIVSFCYGQPEDGNIWNKLFEPLLGRSAEEMNDGEWLYRDAVIPEDHFNVRQEPLLTYIQAYELYQTPWFRAFRQQYHRVFAQHVRLRGHLLQDVERFVTANLTKKFVIAAHVRHPAHVSEQRPGKIAAAQAYFNAIRREVARRGLGHDDWRVFLATDQERVVEAFRSEFGSRVCFFEDVRRTREAEDKRFDTLSKEDQRADGNQLQHLVASSPGDWSVKMAEEVVRDAYVMARSNILLHVVSNVSTAVSYMNPDVELIFCE